MKRNNNNNSNKRTNPTRSCYYRYLLMYSFISLFNFIIIIESNEMQERKRIGERKKKYCANHQQTTDNKKKRDKLVLVCICGMCWPHSRIQHILYSTHHIHRYKLITLYSYTSTVCIAFVIHCLRTRRLSILFALKIVRQSPAAAVVAVVVMAVAVENANIKCQQRIPFDSFVYFNSKFSDEPSSLICSAVAANSNVEYPWFGFSTLFWVREFLKLQWLAPNVGQFRAKCLRVVSIVQIVARMIPIFWIVHTDRPERLNISNDPETEWLNFAHGIVHVRM